MFDILGYSCDRRVEQFTSKKDAQDCASRKPLIFGAFLAIIVVLLYFSEKNQDLLINRLLWVGVITYAIVYLFRMKAGYKYDTFESIVKDRVRLPPQEEQVRADVLSEIQRDE